MSQVEMNYSTTLTQTNVIEEARSWIGTPFMHQGRVKGIGVDCVGLLAGVARDLGIQANDRKGYGNLPHNDELRKALKKELIPCNSIIPACVLLMKITREPQHVAIYTFDNTIVHSYFNVKGCVEHRLDERWRSKIEGYYLFPGVSYNG